MASPNRDAEPDDLPDAEIDARWSDIVARLDDVEQSRPAVEGIGPPEDDVTRPSSRPSAEEPSAVQGGVGPRDWPTGPDVEEHFVPPDPEPVAHRDPLLTLAWFAVVAVPVLTIVGFIIEALVPALSVPGWITPAAGGVFLAGVAVLLWRMPHRRDPDDHDPGAVV